MVPPAPSQSKMALPQKGFNHRNTLKNVYAPDLEVVDGAYWFGPVRLSVMPFVGYKTRELFELGT